MNNLYPSQCLLTDLMYNALVPLPKFSTLPNICTLYLFQKIFFTYLIYAFVPLPKVFTRFTSLG